MDSNNDYLTVKFNLPNKTETKTANRKRKLLHDSNEIEISVNDDLTNSTNSTNSTNLINSTNTLSNNIPWTTIKHKFVDADSNKKQKLINYVFDIIYEESTAKKCIDQYTDDFELELKLSSTDTLYENLKATLIRIISQELWLNQDSDANNEKKIRTPFISGWNKTFKLGDIVKISYHPFSQRYIGYYYDQSFIGRIIFIDSDKDNAFFLVDTNKGFTIKSLEREGCHFMGMSRGYDYNIEDVD